MLFDGVRVAPHAFRIFSISGHESKTLADIVKLHVFNTMQILICGEKYECALLWYHVKEAMSPFYGAGERNRLGGLEFK